MGHAGSSNTGSFLDKRGCIPLPEQVKCHFVSGNCVNLANIFFD